MVRTRGCLWLTAGVVVAILAGVVAFLTLNQLSETPDGQGPLVAGAERPVVVATQNIEVGTLLTADMLEARDVPAGAVPEGYVDDLENAIGKITLGNLVPGEVLLAERLADPNLISGDGRIALVLSDGEVLMAFPIEDLMSRIAFLKPGDHVDLLFSLDFPTDRGVEGRDDTEQATFNLLQNLTIAAIVGGETTTGGTSNAPQAILLTVTPQDALTLKYVKDAGGIVDIVVRAPGDEGPFETEPVDVDYMLDRYEIPNAVGR
ncbi:MAG: Flp pilus assembly protein CpaB [Chloroflexota bacterium]|nr:Flp pilus assembly protein CpaB [Chloroflexota bacterium]